MSEHSRNNIYFASDFHLGIPDYERSLMRERKLIEWLDSIKQDAKEVYLMGDVFDFWFEYKTVIPKGFTRLFGKLAEFTDNGIPVHLFRGNHDIWAFKYLNEELNIEIHREPMITQFGNKTFYLAHGDGLGPGDNGYKFLKRVFEFKPNQWLFRWMHPDVGARMGLYFSKRSRLANIAKDGKRETPLPLEDEMLYHYALDCLKEYPEVDVFIFGHRHIMVDHLLNEQTKLIILGDWITNFSYAVFDGENTELKQFKL